jgi:hypothetical protein
MKASTAADDIERLQLFAPPPLPSVFIMRNRNLQSLLLRFGTKTFP